MSNPHDQKKLLESRRKVEDQVIAMEHSLKDNRTTLEKAQFELKTTAKIEKRQKAVSSPFLADQTIESINVAVQLMSLTPQKLSLSVLHTRIWSVLWLKFSSPLMLVKSLTFHLPMHTHHRLLLPHL